MDEIHLAATLPEDAQYVYGTVNGTETVWTHIASYTWETIAPRSFDDVYNVELQIYKPSGGYYEAAFTLFYGVNGLIFDRTAQDVAKVNRLATLRWDKMSQAEKDEWSSSLKGAYNATDLNRVGSAVEYIYNRFKALGYDTFEVYPKSDWDVSNIPWEVQMQTYLENVEKLREILQALPSTPQLPEDMNNLTHTGANNIEKILFDVNQLINGLVNSWYYSDEVFCGEV